MNLAEKCEGYEHFLNDDMSLMSQRALEEGISPSNLIVCITEQLKAYK